jgi:hypothetical protein
MNRRDLTLGAVVLITALVVWGCYVKWVFSL